MSKILYQVVEVSIKPGPIQTDKMIKANLKEGKAKDLRDRLANKQSNFDPNNIISYIVQPMN